MKKSFAPLALLICLLGFAGACGAQASASKPLRWIVPYAAGGGQDFIARTIGQQLSVDLGRPVIVENKPGGNGSIAANDLIHSPRDGSTIMSVDNGHLVFNPDLYTNLAYHPDRDMTLVSTAGRAPLVLIAGPATEARSLRELIAQATAAPGKLSYASPGPGSPHHIAMELVKQVTGTFLVHIPYRGGNPALADVASGQVQVMMADMAFAGAFVKAGKVRALAVADTVRTPLLPDVPTFAELGMPAVEAVAFSAVVTTAGTPAPIVDRLNQSLADVLRNPAVAAKLSAASVEPYATTPAQFAAMVQRERARWKNIRATQNIKVDQP
jgi:tripartite-type tricarboxylate transporter receptor subunit TctC